MNVSKQTIHLDEIDINDTTFVVSSKFCTEKLMESIQNIGLVNPPYLVYVDSKDCYVIVSGYRRIRVLADLEWKEIPVNIIKGSVDEKELSLFSFY